MRSSVEVRTREKTKTSGRRETTARGRRRARAIGDRGRARDANAATRAPSEDAIARGGIHPPARDETAAFGATLAPRFAQDFVDAVAAANPAAATSASKHVAFISCRRIARESA